MTTFIFRRFLYIIPTLFLISIISFIVINLPPGDYLTIRKAELQREGGSAAEEIVEQLEARYGLGEPVYVQYWRWISGFIVGDFGRSFEYNRPVGDLIWGRLGLTLILAISTLMFTWLVAIPIGVYSATHQYSYLDNFFTFISFLGLSIPNFLLALVLMVIGLFMFNTAPIGLFSPEFEDAAWSLARFIDLLKHLWVPVIVVGTAGTASLMRIMRSNFLDVMGRQFIDTARAKGLHENVVRFKHAFRVAINPLISILGMQFPQIISGGAITAIVLGLPTVGPLFLEALQQQDMYLAGTFLMFLSIMLIIGNLFADILLAIVDPRIRYD